MSASVWRERIVAKGLDLCSTIIIIIIIIIVVIIYNDESALLRGKT
jgi:hypothetical protein